MSRNGENPQDAPAAVSSTPMPGASTRLTVSNAGEDIVLGDMIGQVDTLKKACPAYLANWKRDTTTRLMNNEQRVDDFQGLQLSDATIDGEKDASLNTWELQKKLAVWQAVSGNPGAEQTVATMNYVQGHVRTEQDKMKASKEEESRKVREAEGQMAMEDEVDRELQRMLEEEKERAILKRMEEIKEEEQQGGEAWRAEQSEAGDHMLVQAQITWEQFRARQEQAGGESHTEREAVDPRQDWREASVIDVTSVVDAGDEPVDSSNALVPVSRN